MKAVAKMERQISYLDQQDFKKLFPEQYFSKYAAHKRILSFQQQLLSETKIQNSHPLPKTVSQPQLLPTPAPVKISRFDQPSDVIAKNKLETVRMEGFVKELNMKLKGGAVRSNSQIRSPLTGFQAIPQGVFTRLKLIEDSQYEAELAYERQKKRKTSKNMNFVTRSRNHSISESKLSLRFDRSIIAQSAQSKSVKEVEESRNLKAYPQKIVHSGDHLRSLSYGERVSKMIQKAKSQIAVLNPESEKDGVRCILAMNRSIRKLNGLKLQMAGERRKVLGWTRSDKNLKTLNSSSGGDKIKKRKNLIQITENIRQQGEAIQVLSHFQTAMTNRTLRLRMAEGIRY